MVEDDIVNRTLSYIVDDLERERKHLEKRLRE